MNIQKITEQLKKLSLLEVFIILNPFIDLITSFSIAFLKLNITFGMITRFMFLLVLLYYLFFKSNSKYKKLSIMYIAIVILFGSFYLINMYLLKGISVMMLEIKILFKVFYFPILLVTLFNYFEEHKNKFNSQILTFLSIIYLTFILIPILTNTSFSTYSSGKIGNIGWFYSPNEIGAVLAIISPFIIYKMKNNLNKWYVYGLFALYAFIMLVIGTKVPFLGILLTVITLLTCSILGFLLDKTKRDEIWIFLRKPLIIPFVILILIIVFVYQYSNLNFNMNHHKKSLIGNNPTSELKEEDYKNLIFSSRDKYNELMIKKFKLADTKQQLFGMGHMDIHKQFDRQYNIVEIDYMDIFYMYGVFGFIIYFMFLFVLIIDIILKIIKNFKKIIYDERIITYIISVALIFGIALFAGHVFTAPAVSLYPALIISSLYIKSNKNDNDSILDKINGFTGKNGIRIICVIFMMLITTYVLSFLLPKKVSEIELKIIDNQIAETTGLKLKNTNTVVDTNGMNITDKIYNYEYFYDKVLLNIKIVERFFGNNNKLIMLTINNYSNHKIEFKIENLILKSKNDISNINEFKNSEIEKNYNATTGYDKTTLPIVYIEYNDISSLLISKGFKYNNLILSYENNEESKIKKLINENEEINYEDNKINYEFDLEPKESYDNYLMLSNDKLFNNESSIELFTDMLNNSAYTSWLSFEGSYHKLPYSVEPFSRDGYGRNPGAVIAKQPFKNYQTDKSNIFYILTMNSNHTLLNYLDRDKAGVWFTEYTSTWLKKDYKIRAPYVDTRHNEAIGIYLNQVGEYFNNLKIKKSNAYYAKYLVKKYNDNEVIKFQEGNLFPDYFSENHTTHTHASLNHQLGIVNYFFNYYIETNIIEYKNVGLSILKTIENQYKSWIRDDKDLWYQINEKKEFNGRDYKIVTLDDLLNTQKILVKIGETKSPNVSKLIRSKYDYLKDISYDIPSYITNQLERGDY